MKRSTISSMPSKLLAFIVCFAFAQQLHGTTAKLNTCSELVQEFRNLITTSATYCRIEISSAITNIQSNIAATRNDVNLQLFNLNNKINDVSGPNAEKCKNDLAVALAELDQEALDLCYQDADLNHLYPQVDEIDSLMGDTNQICQICGENVNECVTSKMEEIAEQIVNHQNSIAAEVEQVQIKSADCVQKAHKNLSNIINQASENFNACIQTHSKFMTRLRSFLFLLLQTRVTSWFRLKW